MLSASAQGSGSEKSGGPGCLLWRDVWQTRLSDHLPAPGIPDIPDQGPDLLLLNYRGFHVMSVGLLRKWPIALCGSITAVFLVGSVIAVHHMVTTWGWQVGAPVLLTGIMLVTYTTACLVIVIRTMPYIEGDEENGE